ncbi:hypothetical protein OG884_34230 [Streptosporangium sp. NBC_01755]|nr:MULTISPECIES: hypothetical protein [unclassified Streptosporangium]WSA28746.1 hypothetical protein OIE13_13230 [Streptosporangium sp. NBC_01810]WSC99801.1 hypothetical protein OG884_34230 [Streptosporangium sp. NBC_01755]
MPRLPQGVGAPHRRRHPGQVDATHHQFLRQAGDQLRPGVRLDGNTPEQRQQVMDRPGLGQQRGQVADLPKPPLTDIVTTYQLGQRPGVAGNPRQDQPVRPVNDPV